MNIKPLLTSAKSLLILGHHNADPDAVCSMIAFMDLYHSINPEGSATLACDDVSKVAVQVVNTFYPSADIQEDIQIDHDLIVLLDTNSKYQLGPKLERILVHPSKTLVIDHHEENPDVGQIAEHLIVRSDRSSTCEIMVNLYRDLDIPISGTVANLLLTGMIFDTRRFFYADRDTLRAAIQLIDSGGEYDRCVQSLIVRPDRSERIARLKAAGRLRVHDIDGWVVVTSKIGAYEASACRGIIELGADVAIIGGSPSKDVVRLSSRSTRHFFKTTGVNLGSDVMEHLGEVIGGEGGGHPNAAGANGTKNKDQALDRAVMLIRDAITKRNSNNSKL
ncbi:MAG: DHH family phosphoesterase [Candidatus Thorarchaeota archaeon]